MNKPSRRAVVRSGVWAVPVVATGAAVRSFARTAEPRERENGADVTDRDANCS